MYGSKFRGNFGGGAASVSRREKLVDVKSISLFFTPFFLPPLPPCDGVFDAKIFPEPRQVSLLHALSLGFERYERFYFVADPEMGGGGGGGGCVSKIFFSVLRAPPWIRH